MIKATRCFARHALPHRSNKPLVCYTRIPLVLREKRAQNGFFLVFGRSPRPLECSSELGIRSALAHCFNHTSYYDLWRVENGKVAEHWDVMETIAAEDTWQNQNGKF